MGQHNSCRLWYVYRRNCTVCCRACLAIWLRAEWIRFFVTWLHNYHRYRCRIYPLSSRCKGGRSRQIQYARKCRACDRNSILGAVVGLFFFSGGHCWLCLNTCNSFHSCQKNRLKRSAKALRFSRFMSYSGQIRLFNRVSLSVKKGQRVKIYYIVPVLCVPLCKDRHASDNYSPRLVYKLFNSPQGLSC